jgi:hypothetical protein
LNFKVPEHSALVHMHQLEAEAAQLMLMHAEMDVSLSSCTHMVDKWKERYGEIRDSLSSHLQPED